MTNKMANSNATNNNAKRKNGKDVIVCKSVRKVYNKGTPAEVSALSGIDLKIRRGELVSIIGASGSGKSTLLNCIGSLDKPTSGQCVVNGKDTSKLSEDELTILRRNSIGFIFQFFNLIPTLTAIQNVELPMTFKGLSQDERRKKATELLEKIGLEKKINSRPSQLSGGETQRVAICRALANNPAFILADEPTGNLDSKSGQAVMEIFKKLNDEGRTVIIVTHDPNIAKQTNRIIRLMDGKVVEEMI